jgi:YidC/Oxa1 family membrane protein insertase
MVDMAITLWLQNTWLYDIFYNALIFFSHIGPAGSIGIAVIILTIIVRVILAPFSYKAIIHQVIQKKLEPARKKIQQDYKDDKKLQAEKMMELMRENKTNPFSSCLLTLVQIPIILVLYTVFLTGLTIQPDILYSFVPIPETINLNFLGLNLGERSILLGILTGIVQYFQIKFSPVMQENKSAVVKPEDQDSQALMMQSMQKSMKFTIPVMVAIFASLPSIPSAVALYWLTTNLFTIGQELYITRKLAREEKSV